MQEKVKKNITAINIHYTCYCKIFFLKPIQK